MDIAVTGSTGMIGTALCAGLEAAGHRVVRIVRRPVVAGEDALSWDPAGGKIDAGGLEGIQAVVNLAGAGIGERRWTTQRKLEIVESRTKSTALIATTLAGLDHAPDVLVSSSAIGYYGDRGDEVLTEQSGPGDDFLAGACTVWESAATPASDAGIRVTHPRTGVVLSAEGGALVKMLPLFGLGLGGRLGSGRQWWSWISLGDEVNAIRFLLDNEVHGPVNLTAPEPATNAEFTRALATVLHRPSFFRVPKFGPKLIVGAEMATALLFTSARVVPSVLQAHGYEFAHTSIDAALGDLLGRDGRS